MITTGINVGSDGNIILGPGATYGILICLLFSHAIVCSANSKFLARISLITGVVNGKSASLSLTRELEFDAARYPVGTTISIAVALLVKSGSKRVSGKDAFTLLENNSGWDSSKHNTLGDILFQLMVLFF